MDPPSTSQRLLPTPGGGACDACRRRKVKCDTSKPCANCTVSRIPCEYRTLPRKRGRPFKVSRDARRRGSNAAAVSSDDLQAARMDVVLVGEEANSEHDMAAHPFLEGHDSVNVSHGYSPASGQVSSLFPELHVSAPSWQTVAGTSPETQTSTTTSTTSDFRPRPRAIPYNSWVLDAVSVSQMLELAVAEQLEGSGRTVAGCISTCVDLFIQYQFPNTPIAHEPTLRSIAALFDAPGGFSFGQVGSIDPRPPAELQRAFTLITALCALVFSAIPGELLPGPRDLIWPFYHASRATLKLYEELDLEAPHSSSYYIRTWQSAALQNTTGRDWASWHIHGEGTLLAMRARIFDEAVVSQSSSLEARLLRVNFWLMYLADKTAAAFEARPYVINDDYLAGKLTLADHGDHDDGDYPLLLDPSRPCNQNGLETRLLAGFHLKRRLWAAAADVVREVRVFVAARQPAGAGDVPPSDAALARLVDLYLAFTSLVDHLPSWLRAPHSAVGAVDPSVAEYQVICFWAQRSNIMTVYHCMRMLVLQKCVDGGIPEVVGLSNSPVSWAMQKLEIARDFLAELEMAPFACFKAQGESAVERVRRVGGLLLSVVNGAPNQAIEARARHQFEQLLDILANLDSKATDGLETPEFPNFTDFCQ